MTLVELLCIKAPGYAYPMIGRCGSGLLQARAYSGREMVKWLCQWRGAPYVSYSITVLPKY